MPADLLGKGGLLTFLATTDLHGVPRIVKSSHPTTRALWCTAVVICFTLMVYQTTTLLVNFYSNEVTTHFEEMQTKPEFPDVTVCNINPYDAFETFEQSYDDYVTKVNDLQGAFDNIGAAQYMGLMPDIEWTELRSKRAYIVNNPRFEKRSYNSDDTFLVDHFWYGWQFNTQTVVNETITVSWNSHYYRCYTFTSPAIPDILGFSAILYLANHPPRATEFYKFYVEMAMTPGIRLVIHPRGTQPYMGDGISVSPGTETNIFLTQTNVTRLNDPYGKCTRQIALQPDHPEESSMLYSRSSCQAVNRQLRCYHVTCGCLVSYEIYTESMSNLPFCSNISSYNPGRNSTLENIRDILEKPMCDGNTWPASELWECGLSCTEKRYELKAMQDDWPGAPAVLEFYKTYIKPKPEIYREKFEQYQKILDSMSNMSTDDVLEELDNLNLIQKNFLQVNIRLDETIVHTEIQKPSVTWDTMMANVGGTLHFWLGITVLFLAEVAEVICSNLLNVYYTRRGILPRISKQVSPDGGVVPRQRPNSALEEVVVKNLPNVYI